MVEKVCVIACHNVVGTYPYEIECESSPAKSVCSLQLCVCGTCEVGWLLFHTISCDWSMVILFPRFLQLQLVPTCGGTCANFSGPKYTNVSLSNMVSAMSYEQ